MKYLKSYYSAFIIMMCLGLFGSCDNEFPPERDFNPEIVKYPDISIENFSPTTARPGSLVVIRGRNFGDRTEPVTVMFAGVEADVTATNDNTIEVMVPEQAATGKISVKVWLSEKEFADDFVVIPGAKIVSISAERGQPGDRVTITGVNFGNNPEDISVNIGETPATLVSVTNTEIIFTVPDTNSGSIILDVGGQIIAGPYFLIGNELITGALFGHEGSWGDNPDTEITAAVDGDIETFVDGKSNPGYVGYDVGEGKAALLTSVRYVPRASHPQRMVGGEIRGANDPGLSDYMVLHTITETPATGVYTEVNISTTESYRYIYYYTGTGNGNIAEIEFYGNIAEAVIPKGKHVFEFDTDNGGWEPQQSSTYVIEDGKMKVTFAAGGNRADLKHNPTTQDNPWVYTAAYPILAIKYTKPEVEQMRPDIAIVGGGGIFGGKEYDDTYGAHDVYLWDLSQKAALSGLDSEEFRIVQIKIPDVTSGETGYEIDWIRTFKSTAELEAFLGI